MILAGINIPGETATANSWTVYYDKLQAQFGKVNARQVFSYTFSRNGNSSLRYDNAFRLDMQKRGVDITTEGLDAVLADINDFGSAASDLVSSTGSTIKWTLIVAAVLIALVALAMILNPQAAMMASPQGRTLNRSMR